MFKKLIEKLKKRNQATLYFAKGHETVIIPTKRVEDAGYDIYANFDEDFIMIEPHQTKMIPTRLISAISDDYYIQLEERGSTGSKGMGGRCGVIDSGYRGQWFVPITNHNANGRIIITKNETDCGNGRDIIYPYKKAICQAVILPVPKLEVEEISQKEIEAISSERGLGRVGSSDK